MHGKEIHHSPHSTCRSGSRRCFARNSRDARDVEANTVGRKYVPVRSRIHQNLVGTVTGDESTDSNLGTDIDVRVARPLCFLEREAGAVASACRT